MNIRNKNYYRYEEGGIEDMGRICLKLDDKYEERLRQESARLGITLSELIRRNLKKTAESGNQDKAAQLTAEVLEVRKEMRIITGALVKIMQANGLTMEEMKQAGKEFYRNRAVKAPCFSYGDETAQKKLVNYILFFYNTEKVLMRGEG